MPSIFSDYNSSRMLAEQGCEQKLLSNDGRHTGDFRTGKKDIGGHWEIKEKLGDIKETMGDSGRQKEDTRETMRDDGRHLEAIKETYGTDVSRRAKDNT
jgi:hypothetical protein